MTALSRQHAEPSPPPQRKTFPLRRRLSRRIRPVVQVLRRAQVDLRARFGVFDHTDVEKRQAQCAHLYSLTRRSQQAIRFTLRLRAIMMEHSSALFDIDNAENRRHSIVIDRDYLPSGDGGRS